MRALLIQLTMAWVALASLSAAKADPGAQPVTLKDEPTSFTLSNGVVSARVDKQTGNLVSLQYGGQDLLQRGRGYWSCVGRVGSVDGTRTATIRQNPASNGGALAEVSVRFTRDQRPNGFPADVDYRYALARGASGIYVYSVWEHQPGYPALTLAEARYAMKLNPQVFDYLAIDEKRNRVMPSGADWDSGTQLELKEVKRIVTGPAAGTIEHKYDYAAVLSEIPAYGWASTKHRVGLWLVNPSMEYISGGPTKVELTGHLDVNPGGAPTLLNMWVGSHYGGSAFSIEPEESWSKVIGPFFIYCNGGTEPKGLWKDALATAESEAKMWPYAWMTEPLYPSARQRGEVSGKLKIEGLEPDDRWSNLCVGLTSPEYSLHGRGGAQTVDWQRDAKFYQYWSTGAGDGTFAVRNVRPGKYVLRAFADGIAGEFLQAEVTIAAGQKLDVGTLTWRPAAYGRRLWQIGKIDRTAAEFRNGDQYWQWGLPKKFPEQFPNGVNFIVGKSDPARDWNYCQVPIVNGRKTESSKWAITFVSPGNLKGTATLRLGIAGSRAPGGVEVLLNDRIIGNTGALPDTGTMHRDGIRGFWCERRVAFDAQLLQPGTNVIHLRVPAQSWVNGVLYDYVRLELQDESVPAVAQKTPAT